MSVCGNACAADLAGIPEGINIPVQTADGGKGEVASSAGTDHGGVQNPSGLLNLDDNPSSTDIRQSSAAFCMRLQEAVGESRQLILPLR